MSLHDAVVRGPWSLAATERWLAGAVIPLRLAAQAPSGWPLVLSLWFLAREGRLLCATQRSAHVVAALEHDPRCAFEVAPEAPPYRGVRGRAAVTIAPDPGGEVLAALCRRYLGSTDGDLARWLLSRAADEVVLELDPRSVTTWDYRERMGGAA